MKLSNNNLAKKLVQSLVVGSLLLGTSCQSLQGLYSTNADRRVKSINREAREVLRLSEDLEGRSYISSSGILITSTPYLSKVAKKEGIDLSATYYPFLQPGNRIVINYLEGDIINQVIPGSMKVDTRKGRIDVNGKSIDDLDIIIESQEGEKVLVTQDSPTPYSTASEVLFYGKVRYFDPNLSPQSGVVDLPISLTNLLYLKGFGAKADYLAVSIPKGNKANGVKGILAFASIKDLMSGDSTQNLPIGYDYNIIALSKDTFFDDLRQGLGQVGGLGRDILGIVDPAKLIVQDLDIIDSTLSKPTRNDIQKFGDSLSDINRATSAANGIKNDAQALIPDSKITK